MHKENLAALEAVLFACGEPIAITKLCEIFDITELQLSSWLEELQASLQERGVTLDRSEDEVQMVAVKKYNMYIERMVDGLKPSRLSAPTMETLAIVAYRQPITRPEIEEIRGVKVEKSLTTLLSYDLITEVGRRESTGRPILYGTTDEFLLHFGIENLSQLPKPQEQP